MSVLVRFGGLLSKTCKIKSNLIENCIKSGRNRTKKSLNPFLQIVRNSANICADYVPFDDVVTERRCQAKKSVLVQVNSDLSFSELHSYCSQFGEIIGIHHYTTSLITPQHFMLVEFESEDDVSNLVLSGCFAKENDVIPVESSFMWFRSCSPKNGRQLLGKKLTDVLNIKNNGDLKLVVKNGCTAPSRQDVMDGILQANTLSDQIQKVYDMTCLNDLGTRLRYMAARQIECALAGLYPKVTARPFGSTVNGFGKMGCDLDLLLRFTDDDEVDDSEKRLVFHTKRSTTSGRLQQQRHMDIIADIMQLFIPGCSHVRKILQARIPIIKYNQDYAGLECDLSMASMSGVYMSELLYMYGCIDNRVRPLVFTIRNWAQSVGLTNPSPGRWITNFPLTLMVLFFLQNTVDGAILPSFDYLKKNADLTDKRLTDDGVNCTFLRDARKLKQKVNNESSLEDLLLQFFEFYSSFDFSFNAISINEGKAKNKLDHSPLYIVNPLETALNVSKNVSFEECERLKIEVRNAAWQLESLDKKKSKGAWGLALLLQQKDIPNPHVFHHLNSPRLVSVKALFDEETNSSTEKADDELKEPEDFTDIKNGILSMANQNKMNGQFKNSAVKDQVRQIIKMSNDNVRMQNRSYLTDGNQKNGLKVVNRRKTRRR